MSELYELPNGWEWNEINQLVSSVHSGFSCSKKFEVPEGYVHLRTHNISTNGKLNFNQIVNIPEDKIEVNKSKVYKGDILFNNTNSVELVGKTALIEQDENFAYSNHLTKIKVNDSIEAPYLVYYLQLLHIQKYFERICKRWIGQAGVNNTLLKKINIPLPPLQEQKRIVSKLDTLFEKIDKAIALHQTNMDEADAFMGSVLNEVFGELEEKYSKKSVNEITQKIQSGFAVNKKNEIENGYVHLRTHNIATDGKMNFDKIIAVNPDMIKEKQSFIKKGDILFNNTNSTELAGKTAIVEEDNNYAFSNHLTKIKTINELNPSFFVYAFMMLFKQKYFEKICNKWIGQSGVNNTMLKEVQIVVPPYETQQKIVIYLDQISQKKEKIKQIQKEKMESLKALKASLLDQAFRGEI